MNTLKKIFFWLFFGLGIVFASLLVFAVVLNFQGKASFNETNRSISADSLAKDIPDLFSMGEIPALVKADTFVTIRRVKQDQLKEISTRINKPVFYYMYAKSCKGCVDHLPDLKRQKSKFADRLLIVPVGAEPILNFYWHKITLLKKGFPTYFFMLENFDGRDGREFLNEYINRFDLEKHLTINGYPVSIIFYPDSKKSVALNADFTDEDLEKFIAKEK